MLSFLSFLPNFLTLLNAHNQHFTDVSVDSHVLKDATMSGSKEWSRDLHANKLIKRSDVDLGDGLCNESVCLHDAKCIPSFNSFFCNCTESYHGQTCQYDKVEPKRQYVFAPMVIYNSPTTAGSYIRVFIFAKTLGDNLQIVFDSESGFKLQLDARHFVKYASSAQEVCKISIKKIITDLNLAVCSTLLNESMYVTKMPFAMIYTIKKNEFVENTDENATLVQINQGILRITNGNGTEPEFETEYPFATKIAFVQCRIFVDIEGCGASQDSSTSLKPQKEISIGSRVTLEGETACTNQSLRVKHTWMLYEGNYPWLFDPDTGSTPKLNTTQALDTFTMDPYSLNIGNYTLFLKVGVAYKKIQSANAAMCWFKIVSVPLVAKIVGGKDRTVDVRHSFTLDATPTINPTDDPRYQITYEWSCNLTSEAVCKKYQTTDPVYMLGAVLKVGLIYNFTLRVSSTSPFSSPAMTYQVVHVKHISSGLQITQVCLDICDEYPNPSEIIKLRVSSLDSQNWDPDWQFKWTYSLASSPHDQKDASPISQRNTPYDILIIDPNQLTANTAYIFTVEGGKPEGQADFSLTTAAYPVTGSCVGEPTSGQAVSTEFTLNCSGFSNSHVNGSLNFKFYELYFSNPDDGLFLGTSQSGVIFKVALTLTELLARVEGESGMFVDVYFSIESLTHAPPTLETFDKIKKEILQLTKSRKTTGVLRRIDELINIWKDEEGFLTVTRFAIDALEALRVESTKDVEKIILSLKHILQQPGDNVAKGDTVTFYKASKLASKIAKALKKKIALEKNLPSYSVQNMVSNIMNIATILMNNRNTSVNDTDRQDSYYNMDVQNCKRGSKYLGEALATAIEILSEQQVTYADAFEYSSTSFLVWLKKDTPLRLANISRIPGVPAGASVDINEDLGDELTKLIPGAMLLQVTVFEENPLWWHSEDPSASPVMDIKATYGEGKSKKSIKQLPEVIDLYLDTSNAETKVYAGNLTLPLKNATTEEFDYSVAVFKIHLGTGIQILKFRKLQNGRPIKFIWLENKRPTYKSVKKYGVTVTDTNNEFFLMADSTESFDLHYIGIHTNMSALAPGVRNISYEFESQTISCRYWDESRWSSEGCKVAPDSSLETVHCQCYHLSFFKARVFVAPNFINPVNDVNLLWTIKDNYFVAVFVLCVFIFYFVSLYWSQKADKKDKLKEPVIVLEDNYLEDEYLYIVTVFTGYKANSGTSANVAIRLVAQNHESKVHVLKSPARRTHEFGSDDWYLICTAASLGEIVAIQIWHDNSGSSPDWYLWKVEVRDVQTNESWIFLANRWLSVLQADESIYADLLAAPPDDLSKVSVLSRANITFGFKEVHSWISIFARHPRATVSRSQRLSLLISLLFSTMVASMMFYHVEHDEDFYEYEIKLQQLLIALESMLIESLFTSVILFCFNKSMSSHEQSHIHQHISQISSQKESHRKVHFTKGAIIELTSSYLKNMMEINPLHPAVFNPNTEKPKKKDVWLIVAWSLCILNIVFCGFILIWLSLKVGKVKSTAWLTSVLMGLVQGMFITKPLRIILYGVMLASIYHVQPNVSAYHIDAHEVKVYQLERFKHTTRQEVEKEREKAIYRPPTKEQLQHARQTRRRLELKKTILFDILHGFAILFLMFMILHYVKFTFQYQAARHVTSVLTKSSYSKVLDAEAISLHEVTSKSKFYLFVRHTLIPIVHKYLWFDTQLVDEDSGWISANNLRLIGSIRLRQKRVKKGPCPEFFNLSNCYDFSSEDTDDYEFNWSNEVDPLVSHPNGTESIWLFKRSNLFANFFVDPSGSSLDTSGYVASLGTNIEDAEKLLSTLEDSNWLDGGSHVIFVEFALINPSNDFIAAVKLMIERFSFGYYATKTQVDIGQVHIKNENTLYFSLIIGATFIVFFSHLIHVLIGITRYGFSVYVTSFWNCFKTFLTIFLFLVVLVVLLKTIVTNEVVKNYRLDETYQFEQFTKIILWYKFLMICIGMVIFLTFLGFLKCLQYFLDYPVFEFTLTIARYTLYSIYFIAFLASLYVVLLFSLTGSRFLYGIVPIFIESFLNYRSQKAGELYQTDVMYLPLVVRFIVILSFTKCILVVYYYAARKARELKIVL